MSTVTYEQLCTPLTRTDCLRLVLPVLAGPTPGEGFSVDSWGPTSLPRLLVEAGCELNVDTSTKVVAIGKFGTLDGAAGPWLDLKAQDDFGLERLPALPARGTRTLVESIGSPHTWNPGELLITCSVNEDLVFSNVGPVSLSASSSVAVEFVSSGVGTQYNVDGATVGELATPVPGVAISPTTGLGWLTQVGADEEEDEPLRVRCRAARVVRAENEAGGSSGPEELYVFAALGASADVNRVRVQEHDLNLPPDPAVSVYVAGPAGVVPPAIVNIVDLAVQKRRPLGTLVEVTSATGSPLDLYGVVSVKAAYRAAAQAKISELLTRWVGGGSIDVNGERLDGLGIGAAIYIAQIVEILMSVPGVVNVVLTDGGGTPKIPGTHDVLLAGNAVATLTNLLTFTEV